LTSITNNPSSQNTPDVQTQMLAMMAESLSKLSTVISEKPNETKAEWPEFGGEPKKFKAWYQAIIAQISLHPWNEFYDSSTHNITVSTFNTTLNGKLYSKLLLALEGTALQHIISRKHLRANGLQLLRELVQTYRPTNVPEVIAAKTSEFWGQLKRQPHENVDQYFNRFHDILEDLRDAEEPISDKSAIHHFIFTLGIEFKTIQNNYRIGNLPAVWTTQDWPTILTLCRDYFNSVRPQGNPRKENSTENSNFDMVAHKKKVREWFLNPHKFQKEIDALQEKHVGKCMKFIKITPYM